MNRGMVRSKNSWLVAGISLILCLILLVTLLGPLAAGRAQADERGNKTNRTEFPTLPGMVDWPMFHFNQQNTGTTPEVVTPPLALNWTYTTGGEVYSSPAISNGIVYTGSEDDKVYALNATTGAWIWDYTTGGDVSSSPAVSNGIVYVGSEDGKLYALNAATGAWIWDYTTGWGITFSSPVVSNGIVYIGSTDGKLYALNATTGAWIWDYTTGTGGRIYSSPAVSGGIVYVGADDNKIYALNADTGAFIWSYTTGAKNDSSPAVSNGIVYIGSWDNNVYALNATTGTWIWDYTTGGIIQCSPTVSDGVVYIGSSDYKTYALNATTGIKIWECATAAVRSSPAGSNGVLYMGAWGAAVYAVDTVTGTKIWDYTIGNYYYSSPAVSHGMVYIGSSDYNIFAFGPVPAYTVTFDTVPADTGMVTFDSLSNSDGDTVAKIAGTYGVTANPDTKFTFTRWETEGGVSVDNSNLTTTNCNISGDGTLRMVQTALDTDGDGMPDWWEDDNGLIKTDPDDADDDGDVDGLTNLEEYQHGTKPDVADTDGGGIYDGEEVDNGWDPLDPADDLMPDLIVSEKYEQWMDFGAKSYNVTYTIKNQGNAASGASQTRIYIDAGLYDEQYVCPALAAGATDSRTVGPYTMSGDSDTILVYVDPAHSLDERDEDNNFLVNEWGTLITGVTNEVNCDTLPGVSLQLFDAGGVTPIGSPATSDGSGDYSLAASVSSTGTYLVVASKAGYQDESQVVNISALGQEYEVNFRADYGLIPDTTPGIGGLDYFLLCMNLYLEDWGDCNIGMDTFLAVMNAYLELW